MAEWDKRQWIVPTNTEPDGTITRAICVPNDRDWIATISGALRELIHRDNWNLSLENGDLADVDLATDVAFKMYKSWIFQECAMTCEQIIDCIESDPDVGVALQQWMNANGYGTGEGTPSNPSVYAANPLLIDGSLVEDCDNDKLFGAITELVDYINSAITDFFEVLELESNGFERAQIIGEAIPISDALGGDTIAASFDQALEELAEGYAANFTETLEDTYRCALFCLVIDTCEIDFVTMADYFAGRVGESFDLEEAFGDFIQWVAAGSWASTTICDAAFAVVMSALAYGSSAMGVTIDRIAGGAIAALGTPSDDWEFLCEDCDPPQVLLEIGDTPCSGEGAVCGTISHVGVNTYRITATDRASDSGVMLRRQGGGNFRITSSTLISGAAATFRGWCVGTTFTSNAGAVPTGININGCVVVQALAAANFTYEITVSEPV